MGSTVSDDERSEDYAYRNRAIGSGVGAAIANIDQPASAAAKVRYVAIDEERLVKQIPTFLCPNRRPVHFLLGEHQPRWYRRL